MDKTVLIVDDGGRLRDRLTEYPTPCGFQVSTLPEGTAIQRAIKERSLSRQEDKGWPSMSTAVNKHPPSKMLKEVTCHTKFWVFQEVR